MIINPITLEVFKNKFASVAEEMGMALTRAAYSPNIKERRDFSCAVFDAEGRMVAQAAHIPVHLGSMPLSVAAILEAMELSPGDMAMVNDPFKGGTHLPDITLVAPVYAGGDTPLFYVASRAHHADVGGMSAGSMPLSTSIFQEGLVIPPVRIVARGEVVPDVMNLFLANVRTPQERQGDFAAQITANRTGVARLEALVAAHGRDAAASMATALMDYAGKMMAAAIAAIPDGTYRAEDCLDDDGAGGHDITVRLVLTVDGDQAELDFTGSDPETPGCVNAVKAIAVSAALYVFRALAGGDTPTNAGCLRPITVRTKAGTVVDARFPAAVAGGNVETSQRIVDVILAALAEALPGRIPAASQGTMNNVALGGVDPRTKRPFTYYETLAGGAGADAAGPGQAAVHSHMTNTLNTPIEALEYAYPLRVTRYALRRGSGGPGKNVGGDGLVREIEALVPVEVTILSDRRLRGPWGLDGGGEGAAGVNVVTRRTGEMVMPGKFHVRLRAGDRLRVETPGGGGYGPAA
ncbi:5-oxoprolinase (ATP-hydrolyzing) [Solidesulfovibrio carbinoliphilus subsp. oakridgensis]|uniref:5-oxoprolinase (ATP-hydrolyzing) n=1 Tax=Solidesulfovibrio carbinoliphilus subsp. oakridgensis TaxID=694327 RepID=G7Q6A1_9BACT|nr:hydantoinase B/oxoprolinase family protein [Solidesulfovibrio carbinoliphilus]EHJ47274.1 5-oxoprolinase (ATP-hydrolyzing) [Solidesulfovibrio carbinoliphilus subsp. oakridgensis]